MPHECVAGSCLSPVRTAAYTRPVSSSTASADAGAPTPYAFHSPLPPPAAGAVPLNDAYASLMPAPDVSTASMGPYRSMETYARLLATSSARSPTTFLVMFVAAPPPPGRTSPWNSSIVPLTACVPRSMRVRLALPSPFHGLPSHPRPRSPRPHMWAT